MCRLNAVALELAGADVAAEMHTFETDFFNQRVRVLRGGCERCAVRDNAEDAAAGGNYIAGIFAFRPRVENGGVCGQFAREADDIALARRARIALCGEDDDDVKAVADSVATLPRRAKSSTSRTRTSPRTAQAAGLIRGRGQSQVG